MTKQNRLNEQMEKTGKNVVAIGNFDGIHLGHQEIIKVAKKIATKNRTSLILITFNPNPKIFFKRIEGMILTDKQKSELINSMNINRIEYLDFEKIYKLNGLDFVKNYLKKKYSMKYLVVGENFKLGKGREWNIKKLKEVQNESGFSIIVVPSVKLNDEKISSTKIRKYLADGNLEKANMMLGREYCIEGEVVAGDEIGRKLGFPTINFLKRSILLPKGVFETKTDIDGKLFNSITYVGGRPTLKISNTVIETHIFNFSNNVYGKNAKVYFTRKLRDEIKFESEKKLSKQIKKDIMGIKVDKKPLF